MPIKNRQGRFVGVYNDKPYALFGFLDGEHNASEDNVREVAKAIGILHTLTIHHKPEYTEARATFDPAYCWSYATENARKIKSETEAQERLEWLEVELEKLQLPDALPMGICHCDTNPSNFLYKQGKISAVLDFDQSSYTWLLYDVAQLIYWWAWQDKGEINFDVARELLTDYQELRKLAEEERRHLYDVLKMVNLVSSGWFFDQEDFNNDRRRIELLTTIGREEFHHRIFV